MKELLQKFFGLFTEGIEKLEANNQEEALAKFKEASLLTTEVNKEADTIVSESQIEESVKKYAEMYFNGDNMKELFDEMKTTLKSLKDEKEKDDELLTKTIENVLDRLEKVEQVAVSKINS